MYKIATKQLSFYTFVLCDKCESCLDIASIHSYNDSASL